MIRCACGFEDTLYKMYEQMDIPRHIKLEVGWDKIDGKTIIERSLDCSDNVRKIFEEISDDEVGRLTLRAFYQGQKTFGKKLRIIEDRPFLTPDGEELTNIFIENDFAIYLNLERLKKEDITTIGWCNGRIFPKKETTINIIFHEFVHATHYITYGERDNTMVTLDQIYGDSPDKYLWTYWFRRVSPSTIEEQKFVHEEEFYTFIQFMGLF